MIEYGQELFADPHRREQIRHLLGRTWPGFEQSIDLAAAAGVSWYETSTPFVWFEAGRAVAHAGVLELHMVIAGEKRRVAGMHAVCVAPRWRGRGLARRVTESALNWCHERFETQLALDPTGHFFNRFGFRPVRETAFDYGPYRGGRHGSPFRRLDSTSQSDLKLLKRISSQSHPVSHRLGLVNPASIMVTDELLGWQRFEHLHYCEELGLIAAYSVENRSLQLLGLVTGQLPPLEEILAHVGEEFDDVELHFTPERFGLDQLPALPTLHSEYLMVRGPFAVEHERIVLPAMTPIRHISPAPQA